MRAGTVSILPRPRHNVQPPTERSVSRAAGADGEIADTLGCGPLQQRQWQKAGYCTSGVKRKRVVGGRVSPNHNLRYAHTEQRNSSMYIKNKAWPASGMKIFTAEIEVGRTPWGLLNESHNVGGRSNV
jgi:hypothetical protein